MTGKSCSMHAGDKKLTENIMCKTQTERVLLICTHWWKSINRHIQKQHVRMLTKFKWYSKESQVPSQHINQQMHLIKQNS